MGFSLAQRDAYSRHRALAFNSDTDCDQHRTADHAAAMVNLLVMGVELDKGSVAQRPVAPFLKLLVHRPVARLTWVLVTSSPQSSFKTSLTLRVETPLIIHFGHGQLQRPLAAQPLLQGVWIKLQWTAHLRDLNR
jgi:hypothetical protein